MFNRKIKEFQKNWLHSVQELGQDVDGLIEWFLIQESHPSSTISSADIQNGVIEFHASLKVYESQLHFLGDRPEAKDFISEVTKSLEQLEDFLVTGGPASSNIIKEGNATVDIDFIIRGMTLTADDIKKVLRMPYDDFSNQLTMIASEAKYYAYIGLVKTYLVDIQNNRIFNFTYLSNLADTLHTIPSFALKDFDQFDDNTFWFPLFKYRDERTQYILEIFISGLAGYFRWKTKQETSTQQLELRQSISEGAQ